MTRAWNETAEENRDGATDAVVFFQDAQRAYSNAERAANARFVFQYRVADFVIQLAFAGDALAPRLTRALQHLTLSPHTIPDLEILVWDGATTAMNLPALPFTGSMVARRGDVKAFASTRIRAAMDRSADTLSLLDVKKNCGLFCTRDARALPDYETAAPLKTILYWWLRERGLFLVHAGAVGNDKGGVLLAGKGGSGKSTTALACLDSDLNYVSDDYCLVAADPTPRAFNVYNSAKLTPTSLNLLPQFSSRAASSTLRVEEKRILFLDETFASKIARSLSLRAILLPRVTARRTPRLIPASSNAALGALAISTMMQLPDAGAETLRALERLTKQLPCYILELGSDMTKIPRVIQEILIETVDH